MIRLLAHARRVGRRATRRLAWAGLLIALATQGCRPNANPAGEGTVYLVTIEATGTGSGRVTATDADGLGVIDCTVTAGVVSGRCEDGFASSERQTFTATVSDPHLIVDWSGCSTPFGSLESCQIQLSGDHVVSVRLEELASIAITPSSATLEISFDPSRDVLATVTNPDGDEIPMLDPGDENLEWSSDDETVATVIRDAERGAFVSAQGPGTATVTATWAGITGSMDITVVHPSADVPAIVFLGDAGTLGTGGVWGMEPTGGGLVRVFDGGGNPAVSPDGSRVAYEAQGGASNVDVFVWEAASGDVTNLTSGRGALQEQRASWSPDGASVVFQGTVLPSGSNIYTVAADGTGALDSLAAFADSSEFEPDWGPGVVAYRSSSLVGQKRGIRLVTVATGDIEVLTTLGSDTQPAVSPDGTRVAFVREASGIAAHIWVVDVASKVATQLTFDDFRDAAPDWSPDGTGIVFETTRSNGGIAVLDVATGGIDVILDDGGVHRRPTWHN